MSEESEESSFSEDESDEYESSFIDDETENESDQESEDEEEAFDSNDETSADSDMSLNEEESDDEDDFESNVPLRDPDDIVAPFDNQHNASLSASIDDSCVGADPMLPTALELFPGDVVEASETLIDDFFAQQDTEEPNTKKQKLDHDV